jgi:hypothetical protein
MDFGHRGLKTYDNYLSPTADYTEIMSSGDQNITSSSLDYFNARVSIPKLVKLCQDLRRTQSGGGVLGNSSFGFSDLVPIFGWAWSDGDPDLQILPGFYNTFQGYTLINGAGGVSSFSGGVHVGLNDIE